VTPDASALRRFGAKLRGSSARRAASALPLVLLVALVIGMDVTWCPMAGVFGIPCPSCGLTRATLAVVVGDWTRAHETQPGVWLVLGYLTAVAVTSVPRARPRSRRILGWIGAAILGLLVALWLLRFGGAWGGPVVVRPWRL